MPISSGIICAIRRRMNRSIAQGRMAMRSGW